MSAENGKVCCNCRHNIRFAHNNDVTDIRCYCRITHKPIDYVQGMTHWCRHWSKDVNKSRKEKSNGSNENDSD